MPRLVPSCKTTERAREYRGEPEVSLLFPANMVFHRAELMAIGGFDEAFARAAEDGDLLPLAAVRADPALRAGADGVAPRLAVARRDRRATCTVRLRPGADVRQAPLAARVGDRAVRGSRRPGGRASRAQPVAWADGARRRLAPRARTGPAGRHRRWPCGASTAVAAPVGFSSRGRGNAQAECDAVSVVIPTRDRSRVVARTVLRTLAQRGVELEVIVVDDGSRDATTEALEAIGDARVTVLRNGHSHGVAHARNRGLSAPGTLDRVPG